LLLLLLVGLVGKLQRVASQWSGLTLLPLLLQLLLLLLLLPEICLLLLLVRLSLLLVVQQQQLEQSPLLQAPA
jgi:hypothetical protein